ncbi:ParM/StbA family protein [Trichocoleus sp. FACHB-262]|uniref:ParM/StbA family protein n=1 Tax=Trichocoleus sp. FACHB-262 TaxID=2692869 RepID=UPI0016846153|nr:ParM/StbA family protein [Trichocoleus sp. FACHB-262]MBD2123961.1 ParM/StbA family protein [Trichocoleus sp. FACHB-262]
MTTSLAASSLRTQQEQPVAIELKRPVVVFDGGNRTLQWIDPANKPRTIPAFIKQIDPTWEEATPDEHSVVISSGNEHFCLGAVARDMKGTPVFQDNKCELAKKLVLAAIEPNLGSTAVTIGRLVIALPNSRNKADVSELKKIEGTHQFTRNGQRITAVVHEVKPIDETQAAYKYAMKREIFRSRRNSNGVLDLGGGTGIARLYSAGGSLIREADAVLPGTYDLARRIAARINSQLSTSPDLSQIMDGIERGDFELGTSGFCFQEAFNKAREDWLADIRAELRTRWNQWTSEIGEVLIIGGSACLAEPLEETTKGRFKIARHPQISNFSQLISLLGMASV